MMEEDTIEISDTESDSGSIIEVNDDYEMETSFKTEPMEEEDTDMLLKDKTVIAEEKKQQGNDQYKAQNYQAALKLYSDAISLCPETAAYYANRCACYMMLSKYTQALDDARIAVSLDPQFEKAWVRIVKCCLIMGDIVGTEQAIKKLNELGPGKINLVKSEQNSLGQLQKLEALILSHYSSKSYRECIFYIDSALKIASACMRHRLLKGECLAFLGRCNEALDIAVNIMKVEPTSADAIYLRGLGLYYSDNLDKGIQHFARALQLDPDHAKAKTMRNKAKMLKDLKENGNTLFKSGNYREALNIYSQALGIDELNDEYNSKILYNRALVFSKIGNLRDAVADCTKVLDINKLYVKALLLRARCRNDLEQYEECVADYEAALQINRSPDVKRLLREAKFALKRSKRKDYYKILGVARNATDDEIKKAYRKKALVHHPDRHANSSAEERKIEEVKFKEVGEAYAVLSDTHKKMRYDSGQDTEDIEQDIDPNQMFRTFFQFGGQGMSFNFDF